MKSAVIVLLALCCATSAQAQLKDANVARIVEGECLVHGTQVSPSVLQVASDIVELVDRQDGKPPTALSMAATGAVVDLVQQNPLVDNETSLRFETAVQEELAAEDMAVFINAEACVYAQNYTPDELIQLRTFYRTPLGRKVIAETLFVTSEFVGIGMQMRGTEIVSRAADRARTKLRAEGVRKL